MAVKESMEAGDLTGLLNRIFHYVLDSGEGDHPPEVDWGHCALPPSLNPKDPPRNITVWHLRRGDKQKILAAASKKQSLSWEGQPFYIRQDLTAEVRRQRAEYKEIIQELRKQKLRVGMLYPAQLVATVDREELTYNTLEAARRELQKLLKSDRSLSGTWRWPRMNPWATASPQTAIFPYHCFCLLLSEISECNKDYVKEASMSNNWKYRDNQLQAVLGFWLVCFQNIFHWM